MNWYTMLVDKERDDVCPLPPGKAEDYHEAETLAVEWGARIGGSAYRKMVLLDVNSGGGDVDSAEEVQYLISHVPLFQAVFEMGRRHGHEEFRNDA